MKKSFKALFLSALVFVLAGCYKVDVAMDISAGGKMDVSIIYALDQNAMGAMGSMGGSDSSSTGIKTEDYKELEDKGYKVEEYTEKVDDKNYVGVKITKSYASIDDVVGDGKERVELLGQSDNSVAEANLFTKNGSVYKSNFNIPLGSDSGSTGGSSAYDSLELSYTVTLPKKAISNNATDTSNGGKTLKWDLKYGSKNDIDFEFELGSSMNIVMIIGIVVAVVVVCGGIALVVINKNKKTSSEA